jgi:DNA-binding transcriptional ArsR family regulator
VKALKPGRDEVEEVVFQALASTERREILRIIRTREGGATYSEILGELALTTGNLNYHLKQLEGLVEKDEERRYRLTPFGERAMSVLRGVDASRTLATTSRREGVPVAKRSPPSSPVPHDGGRLRLLLPRRLGIIAHMAITEVPRSSSTAS